MSLKKIKRIPFPGGSGLMPTGAVQFDNDWPGLFIRGDHACALRNEINEILDILEANEINAMTMTLREIRRIIENDVIM